MLHIYIYIYDISRLRVNERWNNKFCYKVASCWLFPLNHTTMHGSMNIKFINDSIRLFISDICNRFLRQKNALKFKNILFFSLLTPRSRVLLENLTGSQLGKEFPCIYGNRRFISAFTSARHPSLITSIQLDTIIRPTMTQ